jgi:hypothetical protein
MGEPTKETRAEGHQDHGRVAKSVAVLRPRAIARCRMICHTPSHPCHSMGVTAKRLGLLRFNAAVTAAHFRRGRHAILAKPPI